MVRHSSAIHDRWQVNSIELNHGNKSRLTPHPLDPRANFRKIVEGKAAIVGDVRVGEQCDVGDAVGSHYLDSYSGMKYRHTRR